MEFFSRFGIHAWPEPDGLDRRFVRHVEQSMRAAPAEDFRREIGEDGFILTIRSFHHPPIPSIATTSGKKVRERVGAGMGLPNLAI